MRTLPGDDWRARPHRRPAARLITSIRPECALLRQAHSRTSTSRRHRGRRRRDHAIAALALTRASPAQPRDGENLPPDRRRRLATTSADVPVVLHGRTLGPARQTFGPARQTFGPARQAFSPARQTLCPWRVGGPSPQRPPASTFRRCGPKVVALHRRALRPHFRVKAGYNGNLARSLLLSWHVRPSRRDSRSNHPDLWMLATLPATWRSGRPRRLARQRSRQP